MKFLVFCPHYPPYIGGLETHAAEFNKYMAQKAEVDRITVFTARIPHNLAPYEEAGKITIIRFPAFHIIPNYPLPKVWQPLFWRQWRQLSQSQVDIVISRTRFSFTSFLALVWAKIRREPWIHIEHGSDYVKLSSRLFSWIAYSYDRTIGWAIFHFSTQNIAISDAVKQFIAQFDKRFVPVVYRGVEAEAIETIEPDAELKRRFGAKTILIFVGRLIDGKGVADFISAIKKLNNAQVIGVIVGDGPQRTKLEELVHSLSLSDQVYFYGQKTPAQAVALVKSADVFINPSYTEGLPSAVIEAGLCRRCIIATNVGGTNEIIEDHTSGLLVSPRQVDQLVQGIKFCLDKPEATKKMGDAAYTHAKQRFSWPQSCDTYIGIFHRVYQSHAQNI